jgi:DNA-binding response OmpR family regulator
MMPKTSGMELMQIIQDHYPELEVIMITGYASIDSAVKATKFGASYLQKPFTPDELMILTEQAVVSRKAKLIQTLEQRKPTTMPSEQIDVDMPFNKMEVERSTSKEFVESLTHSDVPIAKKSADKAYCYTGKRDCRRVIVEGRECPGECPIEKKEKARAKAAGKTTPSTVELIDADMPFDVSEVGKYMSTDYVNCLDRSDIPRAALFGRDASLKYSVLVIDDEPIVCHSVRRILTKKSCAVEEAFDVDAALQKLQLNQYDLVIVDLKMPKRTGMEILESIRTNYPDTPVVMVTGFASIDTAIQATKAGAFNFIPKPFTPEELSKVAEEALA